MNRKYTLRETAETLGLSYGTIRNYVLWGRISATKIGKNRMVSQEEIQRFQAKRMGEL